MSANTKPAINDCLGFGWIKDSPANQDMRTIEPGSLVPALPLFDDLRQFFPPIRNQGHRNASTVFACLAVVEYFEHRLSGAICERSKQFLYSLLIANSQSPLRHRGFAIGETFDTLKRYGAPPEIYCIYSSVDLPELAPQHFGYSGDFLRLNYARLDEGDSEGIQSLELTKECLKRQIPVVFGFETHHLMTFDVPFPYSRPFYSPGWQTVVACGYDDERECLLIRNCWGTSWGTNGYGWLPYHYVLEDHAADFWIAWKPEWLEAIQADWSNHLHCESG